MAEAVIRSGPLPVVYKGFSLFLIIFGHRSGRFIIVTGSHHAGVGSIYIYSIFHSLTVGRLHYQYSFYVKVYIISWRSPSRVACCFSCLYILLDIYRVSRRSPSKTEKGKEKINNS